MNFRCVPALTPRYWIAITLASIFAANLGDFVSHDLHMGHISGVPYIAAAFALFAIGGVWSRTPWEGWYWLAIVAVRTIATNLADLAAFDAKLGIWPVCAVLGVAMVVLVLIRRGAGTAAANAPRSDALYWLTMLAAGTLGTALGDGLAHAMTLPVATVATGVALALVMSLRLRAAAWPLAAYWLAIVVIRTFGTNAGDLFARDLGLAVSTPASGVVLLAVLVIWRERPVVATAIPALES